VRVNDGDTVVIAHHSCLHHSSQNWLCVCLVWTLLKKDIVLNAPAKMPVVKLPVNLPKTL
jgi:hypothetical protein